MYSLKVSVIEDKLREKLVTEFQHMRNQATGTLAQFMDYITYGYMIDNIVLLITGTLHQRPISELVGKCHPLGSFEQVDQHLDDHDSHVSLSLDGGHSYREHSR